MANNFKNFDRIVAYYELDGVLVNYTPIRVGTRSEFLGVSDNPVLRLKIGEKTVPVIPGSSLKGILRAEAERYVKSSLELKKKYGDVWDACNPLILASDEKFRKEHEKKPCVVCGLFGNTGLASHIRIFDCMPDGMFVPQTRTRVAIDRILGGQSGGKLFTDEFIVPGTRWKFRVVLINVKLDDQDDPVGHLVRYLIRLLKAKGIQVGANKSIGYGLVRLEELEIKKLSVRDGELSEQKVELQEILGGLSK